MKKNICFFVFIILLTGQLAYAEDIKIGFVDLIKALNESDSGKKAKADLEFLIRTKQTTIDEKGKAIEKMRGDIEKQSSILSQEAKKSKEDELEGLVRDYQRLVTDSQKEIKKKENEFTNEIIKELRVIVEKIAQEEGYTTIFEKAEGIVLFSKKELDLTENIIKKYNKSKVKER